MNVETCIKERRSVRKYTEAEISVDTLNEIVELARYAPSWTNSQVVRYHIIRTPELLADVAKNGVHDLEWNANIIAGSKALAVISVVEKISGYEKDGSFSTTQKDRWEVVDAGLAIQTFCLAAHAKGIGSVILGLFNEAYIGPVVKLPADQRIVALVALGYPLEPDKAAPPRKVVSELVSYV